MSDIEERKLNELGCRFISGFGFKSADFSDVGIPVIKIGNIQNRIVTIDPEGAHFPESKITEKISQVYLSENDVLIAMTGQGSVGRVGRLKLYGNTGALLNQRVGKFVCDEETISLDYLYYILTSDRYQDYLFNTGAGSGQPNLSPSLILETEIPWFEYKTQKAIASILSSLDDKIDLLHRQNQTLEQMAETLFRQWFVEEPDQGWKERPLSEFGQIICGKTPSKKKPEYFDGEYPFIKIPDMHGKTFVFDTQDSLSEEGFLSQEKKALPAKSINVSCIATVGLVTMNAFPSQTNQQINSIIPDDQYRYYLYCEMKNSYDLLHAMASGGTATLNLNTGNFSKIPVLQPDEETIEKFNEIVSPKFDKIFENQTQIRTLTALRDTLLPKFMSGEVRVDKPEKI